MAKTLKVAVLLAGCGHLDGAEVRESVLTLLALDQHGVDYQCIAPALVALALSGRSAARLTLGIDPGCADAMRRLGHLHQDTPSAREIVIDEALNLVTTPAYMFDDARLSDVWVGIERCVAEVLKRA